MSTRLYRSIIVFGTALGVGAVVTTGCDLFPDQHHHIDAGSFGIIDAGSFGIIDATCFDCDAWHNTIADAPWGIIDAPPFDAGDLHHDAQPGGEPDGAV